MTIQEVLRKTQIFFQEKGMSSARLDAEILLSHALGWDRVSLYSKFDYPMNEAELDRCRQNVRRRIDGEPVAYIVGKKAFYKDDFWVTADVLVPRPETECLVERAVAIFRGHLEDELQIADFGTGSGCIGLSLLRELPRARLLAIDISQKAMEIALKNAEKLQLMDRVDWLCGSVQSISENYAGKFSLIVANPPYIANNDLNLSPAVRKFEPTQALIAEDQGLAEIFTWTRMAMRCLAPAGVFLCEIGNEQKLSVESFFHNNLSGSIVFHKDHAGVDRFFEVKNG